MKNFKTVPIEVLHEIFVYDASTGLLHHKSSGLAVGRPSKGYLKVSVDGVNLSVHRIVWAMHFGEWPDQEVDHHDHDRANNRIDNLRLATRSQNTMNMRSRGALASKGVTWDAKRSKFRAMITLNWVAKTIGHFETEDEAAHAYNKEAIRLHGEFAVLNPIGIQPVDWDRLLEVDKDVTTENSDDWVVRGGGSSGERNNHAKLTKEQVLIIREVYAARKGHKWGATRLAKKFGVHMNAVCRAALGETWAGLERTTNKGDQA